MLRYRSSCNNVRIVNYLRPPITAPGEGRAACGSRAELALAARSPAPRLAAAARGRAHALVCFSSAGRDSGQLTRAIGSAGERLVHTEEVTGSIPVSPTQFMQVSDLRRP